MIDCYVWERKQPVRNRCVLLILLVEVIATMAPGHVAARQEQAKKIPEQLAFQVRKFLVDDDWAFEEEELNNGTLFRMRVSSDNGGWRFLAQTNEDLQIVMFFSVLDEKVPELRRPAIAEFITRANYGLRLGNFEMDFNDGELSYKTSIDVEGGALTQMMIENLVVSNIQTVKVYLLGINRVAFKNIVPYQAILDIEGPGSGEQVAPAEVEELLRLSGAEIQFRTVQDQLATSISQDQSVSVAELSDQELAGLTQILRDQFTYELMRERAIAVIEERWNAEYAEASLAWLNSPIGRTITKKEEYLATPEGLASFAAYRETLAANEPSEGRLAMVKRLDDVIGATALLVETSIAMRLAVIVGLKSVRPQMIMSSFSELRAQAEADSEELYPLMQEFNKMAFLFSYEDIPDQDLSRYIDFLESNAGLWYSAIMTDALTTPLIQGSMEIGQSIPELFEEADQRQKL